MKTVPTGELNSALSISISKFHRLINALNGSRKATENTQNQFLDENSVNVLENTFFVLEELRIGIVHRVYQIVKYIYMVYHIVYCSKR